SRTGGFSSLGTDARGRRWSRCYGRRAWRFCWRRPFRRWWTFRRAARWNLYIRWRVYPLRHWAILPTLSSRLLSVFPVFVQLSGELSHVRLPGFVRYFGALPVLRQFVRLQPEPGVGRPGCALER